MKGLAIGAIFVLVVMLIILSSVLVYSTISPTGEFSRYISPFFSSISEKIHSVGPQPLEGPIGPELQKVILTGSNFEDVEITWFASVDEGQLGGTVQYKIFRATGTLGKFPPSSWQLIGTVVADGSSTYTLTDIGAGDRDTNIYFYYIQAVNNAGNTANSKYAGKFAQNLISGWKFVSVPLEQWDTSFENVLQTLDFDQVRYYNQGEWKSYWGFKKYKGDLTDIDHNMGFWVNVTSDGYLVTAGLVPELIFYSFFSKLKPYWNDKNNRYEGWHMVGYPWFMNKTVSEVLSGIKYSRIEGFDPDAEPFHLKKLLPTDIMSPGNAYWIEIPPIEMKVGDKIRIVPSAPASGWSCGHGPHIFNDKLVWAIGAPREVYMYDIHTAQETFIANAAGPDIYENLIVFYNYTDKELYKYNIISKLKTQVTDDQWSYYFPFIYKDLISFYTNGGRFDCIYVFNVTDGNEICVRPFVKYTFGIKIYENKIVFVEYDYDSDPHFYDIIVYDLDSEKETKILHTANKIKDPFIYGDIVAWAEYRNGNWDIFIYNLTSNKEEVLPLGPESQRQVVMQDDIFVYMQGDSYPDIYMYNLTSDTITPLGTDPWSTEQCPDIQGNKIIWSDRIVTFIIYRFK